MTERKFERAIATLELRAAQLEKMRPQFLKAEAVELRAAADVLRTAT